MLSFGNVSRFTIGPLVGKIWNNMQDVMNGDSDAKLFRLISGHDMAMRPPLKPDFVIMPGRTARSSDRPNLCA